MSAQLSYPSVIYFTESSELGGVRHFRAEAIPPEDGKPKQGPPRYAVAGVPCEDFDPTIPDDLDPGWHWNGGFLSHRRHDGDTLVTIGPKLSLDAIWNEARRHDQARQKLDASRAAAEAEKTEKVKQPKKPKQTEVPQPAPRPEPRPSEVKRGVDVASRWEFERRIDATRAEVATAKPHGVVVAGGLTQEALF